jgi:type VI secretion system secreted protein VgrG
MARYSQEGRSIRVDSPLGADVLLLQRFSGQEGTSSTFHYTLELLSEDDAIDPASLLRGPMTVTLDHQDAERKIHGLVSRFVQSGQHEDLCSYRAEIVPWLWFLNLSWNCRIFQNKTVHEIAQAVFDELGYSDYDFQLSRSYGPREYCVQYRESDFNFVTRLFEEEGIFYYFEHSESAHKLVVTDVNSGLQPCPGPSSVRVANGTGIPDEDYIAGLELETAVHIGKVTLRDYDFTRPSLSLETSAANGDGEEVYGYPGGYLELSDGERYAETLLEEHRAAGKVVRGHGNCRLFQSGYRFNLQDHYRADANTEYLLLRVSHHGDAGDYRSSGAEGANYGNSFEAMPFEIPFRPPRQSVKPRIHGTQTALVVGSSGEEIFTDEYGRVKVQFYWDRQGGKDQNSSCWVRVSHPWAGKSWGGIQIPRIGQEVIVEFLDGDPDRPIITGRVYNAEQPVPYELPANKTQSGIKSRSSMSGGAENFNEIRMEDKKGSELFYIHAEKDKQVMVENDRNEEVGHDESIVIKNDQSIRVDGNRNEAVGKDESITISGNQSTTINKNETRSVNENQNISVGKNRSIDVTENMSETVTKNLTVEVKKSSTLTVDENYTVTVKKDHKETTEKNFSLDVKKEIYVEAADKIELKAGDASLILNKNGDIELKGGKINIKGSGDVVIKGSKIGEN